MTQKTINILILAFLLGYRIIPFAIVPLVTRKEPANDFVFFYLFISFLVITTALGLNKHNIGEANVDQPFVLLLFFSGVLSLFLYSSSVMKFAILIACFVLLKMLLNKEFNFNQSGRLSRQFLIGLMGLVIIMAAISKLLSKEDFIQFLNELPFVVTVTFIEEVIYRGILWMVLRRQNWGENNILIFQAVIFWLSHLNQFNSTLSFWVLIPLLSVLLGVIVRRSQSITSSTIIHMLYNFSVFLVKAM